ncbi:hypothetical protein, partial [Escherichia coli]|uniref:hypothetical protein n=1 Tax=Escherichia coli TaxID=562 RepID=UPI001321BF9C
KGWAISHRQKQKKLIMLPSETMIWQPEFTDKTLSWKPGAVHEIMSRPALFFYLYLVFFPVTFFCVQKKPVRRTGITNNRTVNIEINDVTHYARWIHKPSL